MMMLAMVGLATEQVAGQDPKITFEAPALRVETALAQISKLAGTNLAASPATKDEFLILRFQDVSLRVVMEKIARASAAEWVRESDGYRLVRSAKLLQQQDREHYEAQAAKLAKAQAVLREKLEKDGEFDESKAKALANQIEAMIQDAKNNRGANRNWQGQERVNASLPGGRLAIRLAATLDPAELAKLDGPGRIVFSSSPTAMQRPLSRLAWEPVNIYVKERARILPLLPAFESESFEGVPYGVYSTRNSRKLRDQTPAKVLVEASRWQSDSNVSIQVKVANAAGQILEQSGASLQTSTFSGPVPTPPVADPSGEPPIALSERSTSLAKMFQTVFAGRGDPDTMPPLPDVLKAVFLQPEEHSVSELVYSDLVLGTARARGLNLAVTASDVSGFIVVMLFGGGAPSAGQFLQRMRQPLYDSVMEESEDWVVVRPEDPYIFRMRKVDRGALGRIIRTTAARGKLSLDELGAFAVTTPDGFDKTNLMLNLMFTCPAAGRDFDRAPWQVLRFHGGLTLGQRQALESGSTLSYGQLRPDQKRIYDRIVFQDRDRISQSRRSPRRREVPSAEDEPVVDTLNWEPTECLPHGIPAGATVRLQYQTGGIVHVKGTFGQYATTSEMDPKQLAWYLLSKETPSPNPGGEEVTYTEFAFVDQTKYHYSFEPDPIIGFSGELQEVGSRSATVNSPEKLPGEIWAKVRAALEELRKQRKPPR